MCVQLDRTALAILLVMWVALGLPPMGLFWRATPGWAMWALGALWTLAFAAQQACPKRCPDRPQLTVSAGPVFGGDD